MYSTIMKTYVKKILDYCIYEYLHRINRKASYIVMFKASYRRE